MTPTVRDNPQQHRFELLVDDQVVGIVNYHLGEGRITLAHTEVQRAQSGRGLGRTLVSGVLEQVAERDLDVVPLCPYVRKIVAQDPGRYGHLVPDDVREELDLTHL